MSGARRGRGHIAGGGGAISEDDEQRAGGSEVFTSAADAWKARYDGSDDVGRFTSAGTRKGERIGSTRLTTAAAWALQRVDVQVGPVSHRVYVRLPRGSSATDSGGDSRAANFASSAQSRDGSHAFADTSAEGLGTA
ncbi:hypothetical protein PYCC9005_001246 [Savitreella phatthalungensis]